MKNHSVVSATAAALVIAGALSGCSILLPGNYLTSAKRYSADELVSILNTTQDGLGVTGHTLDDAQLRATGGVVGDAQGLNTQLSGSGVTMEPPSCATQISGTLSLRASADSVSAGLLYSHTFVHLASRKGQALPASYATELATRIDTLVRECSHVDVTMGSSGTSGFSLTLKKVAVTTGADFSVGIQETVGTPDGASTTSPITVTTLVAVDGNLAITATTPDADGATTLAAAVNSVVAAASDTQ